MDRLSDLSTNCAVRKVLVRHWIDLGRISVRTTRGVVWLTGDLQKISNGKGGLDASILSAIILEIKHIPTARRVVANLTNWVNSDDGWQPAPATAAQRPLATKSPSVTSSGLNVWEFKEKIPESPPPLVPDGETSPERSGQ